MSENKPVKYEIYKSKGAFQFRLAPAYTIVDKATKETKPKGAVFIEAAPSTGDRHYAFKPEDNAKVSFALSVTDIGQFLVGLKQGKFNLVHDPNAQTEKKGSVVKNLSLWQGNPDNEGLPTYFIKLTEESGEQKKVVTIPLNASEVRILSELLTAAIPRILGWN